LRALEESPWSSVNHGRGIDEYYLRQAFKPYFKSWENNPELLKARKWNEHGRRGVKGFTEAHFEDAWLRLLNRQRPSNTREAEDGYAPTEDRKLPTQHEKRSPNGMDEPAKPNGLDDAESAASDHPNGAEAAHFPDHAMNLHGARPRRPKGVE
jgi:hypothetical protein